MITILALLTATVAAIRGLWSPCGLSMLSSLNPVSETARGNRFWLTACWYLAGAVAGGALLGACYALGAALYARLAAPAAVAWLLALAAALIAVVSDAGVTGWSLPIHPRQVDASWLVRYRRWIYAGGYGLQIGTGFATYIMTAALYLTAALAVLSGNATVAMAAGLVFGSVRGLGIVLAAPARSPQRLRSLLARISTLATPSRSLAVVSELAVAVAAIAALGGPTAAGAAGIAAVGLIGTALIRAHRPQASGLRRDVRTCSARMGQARGPAVR